MELELQYKTNGNSIVITGSDSEATGDLVIPSTIDGLPVTSIGDWAFSRCSELKNVVIPKSVKTLRADAFPSTTKITRS